VTGPHNLKPEKVVKALERAGWTVRGQKGSHVKLTKEGNQNILSIPVHKGKPIKQGLLRDQIEKAGLTMEEFLKLCK
jgi:predicted RNA binding protein YcfA (HicA-like mRNA interferase family)